MKKLQATQTFTVGVAISPLFVYIPEDPAPNRRYISDTNKEHARIDAAVSQAVADLQELAAQDAIFAAHMELVQDPELLGSIHSCIDEKRIDAEWALMETIEKYAAVFARMENAYMREREADIRDIGGRLLKALKGSHKSRLFDIHKNVILVARDLLPSDTAQMDLHLIAGFVTQEGGPTSHVAIIAKNLGIPALVGVSGILQDARNDMPAVMDAETGEIILAPDDETQERFRQRQAAQRQRQIMLNATASEPSQSADGRNIRLCANVGNLSEIRAALERHPDGVGLFRTEFLFMNGDRLPTEEQQYQVYREAAELLQEKELIVRTLDSGGDKPLPYLDMGHDENPFLGYRAIRICLDHKDIFRTQLRALLRASAFGNLKIMYPMIVTMNELRMANSLLASCKEELRREGLAYNERVPVGMMIETPASVIMAEKFAAHVDFFSIGTNDLTQYILAADRGNKKISYLYDTFDPAVLRCIQMVADASHRAGIPVGMCGEFASNPQAFRLLLGMGLDELSMSASSIPQAKAILRASSYADARQMTTMLPDCTTAEQVREYLLKSGDGQSTEKRP